MTASIAVPLAVGLGILIALYRDSWFDRLLNSATLTMISCPEFFLAYVLMLSTLGEARTCLYSPRESVDAESRRSSARLLRIALPALTLTLVIIAHMMRMTRAALISLLASPYIEMARLKGLSPRASSCAMLLPNAWAPIVNVIAFNLAYLVVGVVVVEVVFVYPGIGQLMVDAVRARDVPVVQACALIFAATYILLNLSADIIAIIDQSAALHRTRHEPQLAPIARHGASSSSSDRRTLRRAPVGPGSA